MVEDPVPWWANFFLLFFFLAWFVRTFVLPYSVSRRTKRSFRYAIILPEERATFSKWEKRLIFLMTVLSYGGFILFFAGAVLIFSNVMGTKSVSP